MKTNKILIILVVLLVAVNIGTLSFLWFGKTPKKDFSTKNKRPQIERFLKKRLKLNDDQLKLFAEARAEHFTKSSELNEDIKNYRKELLRTGQDSLVASVILDNLTASQRKLERLNYSHFNKLRSYCSDSQQKAFDSVMITMFEHQSDRHKRRFRKRRGN